MAKSEHRLQIRDYRLILAIRESGQLGIAATQLGITQPAASRMLAALEQTIGARAFVRRPKGMEPTPVGETLARHAASLLNALSESWREVDAVGAGRAGSVRVGAVTGGAVAFVVPAIRQLKTTASGADIHVDVAPSSALVEGLMKGDYDFVLSRVPPGADPRQFSVQRGRVEEIGFLVRSGHPLAARGTVPLGELAGLEWVIQPMRTPLREAVEQAFLDRGLPLPAEIVNTASLLVTIAYVAASDAISPVTREVAELLAPGTPGSGLAPIRLDEPLVVSPYHVIVRKRQLLTPLAAKLRDMVVARLAQTPAG